MAQDQEQKKDKRGHILFLTAQEPNLKKHWNSEIAADLADLFDTTILAWTAPLLTAAYIAETYTHVVFATVGHYNEHIESFQKFAQEVLKAAQEIKPALQFANSLGLTLWNSNKTYLGDLQDAGFKLPQTAFLDSQNMQQSLHDATQTLGWPLVIKPSVGASGHGVSLLKTFPKEDELEALVDSTQHEQFPVQLIVQEYVAEVKHKGETSLVFINKTFAGAVCKRVTGAPDEFRINLQYGGVAEILDETQVSPNAVKVGIRLIAWLEEKFGAGCCTYMRLDGIIRDDDSFLIMGILRVFSPPFS